MMKKSFVWLLICLLSASCSNKENADATKKDEVLYQIKDGRFTEWYPGKKKVKFEGDVDEKGNRDGKWVFYSEGGTVLSFTMYKNGIREGYSVVKYPNGRIHYHGEYLNDQMVGVWTTYDENGKNKKEQDYGYPESE